MIRDTQVKMFGMMTSGVMHLPRHTAEQEQGWLGVRIGRREGGGDGVRRGVSRTRNEFSDESVGERGSQEKVKVTVGGAGHARTRPSPPQPTTNTFYPLSGMGRTLHRRGCRALEKLKPRHVSWGGKGYGVWSPSKAKASMRRKIMNTLKRPKHNCS